MRGTRCIIRIRFGEERDKKRNSQIPNINGYRSDMEYITLINIIIEHGVWENKLFANTGISMVRVFSFTCVIIVPSSIKSNVKN